jgi:hypothetical protein
LAIILSLFSRQETPLLNCHQTISQGVHQSNLFRATAFLAIRTWAVAVEGAGLENPLYDDKGRL